MARLGVAATWCEQCCEAVSTLGHHDNIETAFISVIIIDGFAIGLAQDACLNTRDASDTGNGRLFILKSALRIPWGNPKKTHAK